MLMYLAEAINLALRSAEQCYTQGGTFMRRLNFTPMSRIGEEIEVTPAKVEAWAIEGAMLRGRSTGSKCDATNSHWGSRDMWFVIDKTNPCNLAVIWAWYEIKYPCQPGERKTWPMASPTCDHRPYTTSSAASDHKTMCIHALGEEDGKKITPHVHRVTLATGIMAQPDGDEATAQALVRHKTVDALRTYYKMLPSKYADMVNRATRIDAAKHSNLHVPEIDPSGTYERISAAINEIEQTGTAAARKGRGGDRGEASDGCTIEQYTVGEYPSGEPIYMDADTVGDPHDVIGVDVTLPNEMWIGFERCRARCTGKKKCGKCKIATARATCTIVAFSDKDGLYVLDAEGQQYAFAYDQIKTHFSASVKERARQATAAPPKGKAPARAAPVGRKRGRNK